MLDASLWSSLCRVYYIIPQNPHTALHSKWEETVAQKGYVTCLRSQGW